MEYYVYITNNCNMNCTYCSVLFDTKKYGVPLSPEYSFDDLERFITSTQKKQNDDTADIYFFGGEPTVDYDSIINLVNSLKKEHSYKINYVMHTNGLNIPQCPKEIVNELSLMILSYNYELIFKNSLITKYFGQTVKAIDYVKSVKKIPVIGRITVSPKTDLFAECCLISSYVDYVYWQLDNCADMPDYEDYRNHYTYSIDLLFEYWMNFLRQGVFLRFVPFISVIRESIYEHDIPQKFYCGYGNSMIYIQTNGKCYGCCDNVSSNSHYIGDIQNGIMFPDINLSRTICKDCDYIKLCGGRCGRMHKDFSTQRIKQFCELNIHTFDLIIRNLSEIKSLINKYPGYSDIIMDPMIAYTEYTS